MAFSPHTNTMSFLNGAAAMVSMVSKGIGRDDLAIFFFPKEDFTEEFKKSFRCRRFPLETEDCDIPLKEAILELLGNMEEDRPLAESLDWLIEKDYGKPERICTVRNIEELRDEIDGGNRGPFFFTTDLFFAVMTKEVLCFITGNFE